MTTPLFLFSLPRSGSTWVQRMLNGHPEIETVAEPWILLPFVTPLKAKGTEVVYGATSLQLAVEEFCDTLPEGKDRYYREVAQMAQRLYEAANTNNKRYFLDKTPNYYLILEEIFTMFPDAKFIFLWRNPLATVASLINSWMNNEWAIYRFEMDAYEGIANLVSAYQKYADRSIAVGYEDLIQDSEGGMKRICAYLELEPSSSMVESQNKKSYSGTMGAKRMLNEKDIATNDTKWLQSYCNPIRKNWARNYLAWIGDERLNTMGYDRAEIIAQMEAVPNGSDRMLQDIARMVYMKTVFRLERPLIRPRDHGKSPTGRHYGTS